MSKFTAILLLLLLFTSCATVVDPNSKKAFYNEANTDVVWDQKVYKRTFFSRQYKAEEMFTDDIETQKSVHEANKSNLTGTTLFHSFLIASIGYTAISPSNEWNKITYYSLITAALTFGLHYEFKSQNILEKSIDKYNKKKNYVLSPYLFEQNQKRNLGMAFGTRF